MINIFLSILSFFNELGWDRVKVLLKYTFIVLGILIIFLSGVYVAHLYYEKEIVEINSTYEKARIASIEKENNKRATLKSKIAFIDSEYSSRLKEKENEIEKLSSQLNNPSNIKRVYIKSSCPVSISGSTTSTSLGNGKSPELTGEARQDYIRLRLEIEQVTKQLLAAQEILRAERLAYDR